MRVVAMLCVGLLMLPAMAAAQQTRAETIAAKQAEKAKDLHEYVPTAMERRIMAAQRAIVNPPAVYAFIGSIYPGGLLAAGPGFRHRYHGTGLFDIHAAWSIKNFKMVETSVKLPALADRRVDLGADARWMDAPAVAHYTPSTTSSVDAVRSDYELRRSHVGGWGEVRPARFTAFGGRVEWLRFQTDASKLGPAIPAASADPKYISSSVFAKIDSRDGLGYTRRGGLYRIDWTNYNQREQSLYSFRRLDAEVNQFVPLLRENWVLAFRALGSTTDVDTGKIVPHFLLPDLGGSRTLRGYPSWRFRDRHRLLLTGEYRWTAGQYVDMALFYDTGKVMAERDFDFEGMKNAYGIGVRFHALAATFLRVELARTADGPSLVFGFGPSF